MKHVQVSLVGPCQKTMLLHIVVTECNVFKMVIFWIKSSKFQIGYFNPLDFKLKMAIIVQDCVDIYSHYQNIYLGSHMLNADYNYFIKSSNRLKDERISSGQMSDDIISRNAIFLSNVFDDLVMAERHCIRWLLYCINVCDQRFINLKLRMYVLIMLTTITLQVQVVGIKSVYF